MLEERKCHGTGKAFGHGCGKMVPQVHNSKPNRVYGIGKSCGCYSKWLMGTPEGKKKMDSAIIKASKPRIELEEAEAQMKQEKGLAYMLTGLKTVCHKYIRERDKGKPCISCGTPWKTNFQAGHYFKAENFSTIKFHEHNINGQCEQCNLRKDGSFNEYSLKLPKRIGIENFKELAILAGMEKKTDFKWDRDWIVEKRKYYNQKLKEL